MYLQNKNMKGIQFVMTQKHQIYQILEKFKLLLKVTEPQLQEEN